MNRTALSGLIIAAALTASPVFAQDLCPTKLQALKDAVTSSQDLGEPAKTQILEAQTKAEAAQQAKDDKSCITEAQKGLDLLIKLQNSKA